MTLSTAVLVSLLIFLLVLSTQGEQLIRCISYTHISTSPYNQPPVQQLCPPRFCFKKTRTIIPKIGLLPTEVTKTGGCDFGGGICGFASKSGTQRRDIPTRTVIESEFCCKTDLCNPL